MGMCLNERGRPNSCQARCCFRVGRIGSAGPVMPSASGKQRALGNEELRTHSPSIGKKVCSVAMACRRVPLAFNFSFSECRARRATVELGSRDRYSRRLEARISRQRYVYPFVTGIGAIWCPFDLSFCRRCLPSAGTTSEMRSRRVHESGSAFGALSVNSVGVQIEGRGNERDSVACDAYQVGDKISGYSFPSDRYYSHSVLLRVCS